MCVSAVRERVIYRTVCAREGGREGKREIYVLESKAEKEIQRLDDSDIPVTTANRQK